MTRIRIVAESLLRFAVRHSSPTGAEWGEAMLGELSHIDGDVEALTWALGGVLTLARQSFVEGIRRALALDAMSARTRMVLSIFVGAIAAVTLLSMSMFSLSALQRSVLLDVGDARIAKLIFAVVLPDSLGAAAAYVLFKHFRRATSSIASAATLLGAHSILFFVA